MQTAQLKVLTSKMMEEVSFREVIPESFSHYLIPGAKNKIATGAFGSVVVSEIETGSTLITTCNVLLNVPCAIEFTISDPLVEMDMALHGAFCLKLFKRIIPQGQFNFFYEPGCKRILEFSKARNYCLFTMCFKKDLFSAFIQHYRMVSSFIKDVELGKQAYMGALECSADFGIQRFISAMLDIGRIHHINIQALDAKVEYLLLSLIEKLQASYQIGPITAMLYDSDRILKAAESLVMEPQNLDNIPQIARKWQVNPQRLKDEFQRLMRMPVSVFKMKLRMEQARQQLLETDKSVREISLSIGYTNAAYFSRVFKKVDG